MELVRLGVHVRLAGSDDVIPEPVVALEEGGLLALGRVQLLPEHRDALADLANALLAAGLLGLPELEAGLELFDCLVGKAHGLRTGGNGCLLVARRCVPDVVPDAKDSVARRLDPLATGLLVRAKLGDAVLEGMHARGGQLVAGCGKLGLRLRNGRQQREGRHSKGHCSTACHCKRDRKRRS